MRKKNLSIREVPVYKRLSRSYIECYYTNKEGRVVRYRQSFDLNMMTNLRKRDARGKELVKALRHWLENWNLLEDFTEEKGMVLIRKHELSEEKKKAEKFLIDIEEGIDKGVQFAGHEKSANYQKNLGSAGRSLMVWLERKELEHIRINELKVSHVREYLDYLDYDKKVAWRSYNSHLKLCQIIFAQLKARKYINKSPFRPSKFSKKRGDGKLLHTVLPFEEGQVIIEYIYKHDKFLFYFILISFFGFARPTEIRTRLKKYHFKLDKKYIIVPGERLTKSVNDKYLTIPEEFLYFFKESWFMKIPDHYYIFGKGCKPSLEHCGHNSIRRRYGRLTKKMYKKKLISYPYTKIYDWKRVGLTSYLNQLAPAVASKQAGHSNIASTLIYYHPDEHSAEISKSTTNLINR